MSNQSKVQVGDYFSVLLAHDISNYNQISRGYLEMLSTEQLGKVDERQARALSRCLRQSNRVQSLIDSVRLVSQLEEPPRPEPMNLDQIIRDSMEKIQSKHADQEIRLHFTAAGRMALADPQLEIVFCHLMDNAVRYSKCEIVEIEVEVVEAAERTWKILLGDNGAGVSSNKQEFLFTRLEERQIHGAGLGLSVCKLLLDRWGGRIWLEGSSKDSGAVFGLTLPVA